MIIFKPDEKTFYKFLSKRLNTVDLKLEDINDILNITLKNTYKRFSNIKNKYYNNNNKIYLNTGHYSQMILFLYELSRQVYLKSINNKEKDKLIDIANKIYFLNVSQSSADLYYEIKLPLKLFCDHPLGAVIGRGKFSENSSLSFTSGCNIGHNKSIYPEIDGDLIMLPKSTVLGKTEIKGIVVLSYGCYVKDEGVLENVLLFGKSPDLIKKKIYDIDKYYKLMYQFEYNKEKKNEF